MRDPLFHSAKDLAKMQIFVKWNLVTVSAQDDLLGNGVAVNLIVKLDLQDITFSVDDSARSR